MRRVRPLSRNLLPDAGYRIDPSTMRNRGSRELLEGQRLQSQPVYRTAAGQAAYEGYLKIDRAAFPGNLHTTCETRLPAIRS